MPSVERHHVASPNVSGAAACESTSNQSESIGFAAGTVAAIRFTLCALAVSLSPGSATALAGNGMRLDPGDPPGPDGRQRRERPRVLNDRTGRVFGAAGLCDQSGGGPDTRAAGRRRASTRG